MIIESNDGFLKIEPVSESDIGLIQMEARIETANGYLAGCNDSVLFSVNEELTTNLSKFAELAVNELTLEMTEGCSLLLKREIRGNIKVIYTLKHWKIGNEYELKGHVDVSGEQSTGFLKELESMVIDSANK